MLQHLKLDKKKYYLKKNIIRYIHYLFIYKHIRMKDSKGYVVHLIYQTI